MSPDMAVALASLGMLAVVIGLLALLFNEVNYIKEESKR